MRKFILYIGLSLALCSCSFLDVTPSVISKETYYKTESEAKYGLAGVYGAMNNEAFYGNYYSLMIANTDDLCYFNRPSASSTALQQYKFDASDTYIYQAWTRIYAGIRNANAYMEAIKGSEFDKDEVLYTEARFLRAYYHFILAQTWGDVPLRDSEVKSHAGVMGAAKPQFEVLSWSAKEMEECLARLSDDVSLEPSRVTASIAKGILARVYLFLAGKSVEGGDKNQFFANARKYADEVIKAGKHSLNPDYSKVFIKMIMDEYDKEYHESMWEVEFYGDRTSASYWSNGRIGDVIGLQSSGSSNYSSFKCNYSYGMYDGSLRLWDLYWQTDRTEDENADKNTITDARQNWNLPPYNYSGSNNPPYGNDGSDGTTKSVASVDKSPYAYDGVTTTASPVAAPAIRNCGKYRREVEYEGVKTSKNIYTTINYPLLRYSDILLMYAEASNEIEGPTQDAYNCVKQVRDRAGIKTLPFESYNQDSFRQLIRNERGRELCFESLRKYDLIRWGIFVEEMQKYKIWSTDDRWSKNAKAGYASAIGEAVSDRHILLPIPAIELGVNNQLRQNPLW